MGTVVAILHHRTTNRDAVPTSQQITSRFFAALLTRGFPVVGGGLRITRVIRPTAVANMSRTRQGVLAVTAPITLLPPELALILAGPLAGAAAVTQQRDAGTVYTTVAAVIDADPTTDAAKAKRELLAGFRREFPSAQGWYDLEVVDYVPSLHGQRAFWSTGEAQGTRTRDHLPSLVADVVQPDENPIGPNQPGTPEVLAARAQSLVAAGQSLGAAAGATVAAALAPIANLPRQLGTGILWTVAGVVAAVAVGLVGVSVITRKSPGSLLSDVFGMTPAGRAKSLGESLRSNPARPPPPPSLIAKALDSQWDRLAKAQRRREISKRDAKMVRGELNTAGELLGGGDLGPAWATMSHAGRQLTAAKR